MIVGENETLNQISFENRQRQLQADAEREKKQKEQQEEEDKKSPFKNFAQLNRDKLVQVRSMLRGNPNAAVVFMFIVEHMDKMNALVCSYKVMQEQLDMGRTTLSNAIKYLKEKGFLYVYKTGTANVYCLNPDVVWTSYGKNTRYCKFPANVILSASEQEETVKAKYTMAKIMDDNS